MPRVFVLDVDGVIIGRKEGINFPFPHEVIINTLKEAREHGAHICLCTGRALFATIDIIKLAGLDDPHISDGGSLIVNSLQNHVVMQNSLSRTFLIEVLELLTPHNVYVELYTRKEYFIEDSQQSNLTETHAKILGVRPTLVQSLKAVIETNEIIKVFVIARDVQERQLVTELFIPLEKNAALTWGMNANALPAQYGWIAPKGISKKEGVIKLSDILQIPLEEFVGVGDTISDWDFIEPCGYGAAMGDGDSELIQRVQTKGSRGIILPGTDLNGLKELFALLPFSG